MDLRYFETIAEAQDQQSLFSALESFTHELDFERFSLIALIPASHGMKAATRSIANTPKAFLPMQYDNDLASRDPVYTHVCSSTRPFTWDQSTYVNSGTIDLWDNAAPHGYGTGVAAAASFGGPRLMFGIDRVGRLPRDSSRTAYLISQIASALIYAQDKFALTIGDKASIPANLTEQQVRILRLIAEGKSDGIIGQLLQITEHTVNYHVRKIFQKLGIATRSQAVQVANAMRII